MVKNLLASADHQVRSPGQEDPLEKEMATHSGIPAGNSMDRGVCRATVHRVMEKSDRTEQLSTVTCFIDNILMYFLRSCVSLSTNINVSQTLDLMEEFNFS